MTICFQFVTRPRDTKVTLMLPISIDLSWVRNLEDMHPMKSVSSNTWRCIVKSLQDRQREMKARNARSKRETSFQEIGTASLEDGADVRELKNLISELREQVVTL